MFCLGGGILKHTKEFRILDMYQRLCEGKIINKQEEAERHGISPRSIQRDISSIRCFLMDSAVLYGNEMNMLVYLKEQDGYKMVKSCEYINDNNMYCYLYIHKNDCLKWFECKA